MLRSAKGLEDIFQAARGVDVQEMGREQLDRMSKGVQHQGVLLEAEPLPVRTLEDWLEAGLAEHACAVVLDGVEDPQNFGAIVRSAAALGAAAVVFAKDRSAPLSPSAVKAAAGGMEYVDLVQVTNLRRSLEQLKAAGFWIGGLDASAEQDLWDASLTGKLGLVIGSEGKGMRRLVQDQCDFLVKIPLTGPITSLNASVSAALALGECLRQRQKTGSR